MDDTTRHEYQTLLSWAGETTTGLGSLIRDCGTPLGALQAPPSRLAELPGATQRIIAAAREHWPASNPRRTAYARMLSTLSDLRFLPLMDSGYPEVLRNAPDPPPWLFVRGVSDVLAKPGVAIVGSRRASHAGLDVAGQIARRLAASGYSICSGLALGIDAAAHRGALETGVTMAVLASGIDRISPARHQRLAEQIMETGCVLSELPSGTPPQRHQFPRRNRIISGLCCATIVIESALPSGTLHTAHAALEQGRDVYVLPWSIFHPQGAGCLRLLRDGATPICSLEDLPDLFPLMSSAADVSDCLLIPRHMQKLIDAIGDKPISVGELASSQGMTTMDLLPLLGEMEVAGWVRRVNGLYERVSQGPCQRSGSC
ncbi:MAG: DNA-processing protein DprA [Congregibacter sp.]